MKTLFFIITFMAVSAGVPASDLRFFPSEKIAADPHSALLRSPAFDVLYIIPVEGGKNYIDYNFGTKFGILYFWSGSGIEYEFSGYGGIFTRFEPYSQSFNFRHADFLGGGAFDIKYKRFTFENMIYHNSSHIGDDYIHYENATYHNVGFDAVKHYTTINILAILDASIGFEYKFSRRPDNIIFHNKSLFLGNRIDLLSICTPVFLDWELEFIGLKHSPNVGARLGVYLSYLFNVVLFEKEASGKERQEFAVYYYYGYSKEGYFYNTKENIFLFGPTYRF